MMQQYMKIYQILNNLNLTMFGDIERRTCAYYIDQQSKYECSFTRNYLYLKLVNKSANINIRNNDDIVTKDYPNDIQYEYQTYINHELEKFKMTQYVSSFYNNSIDDILREFNFMNPIHYINPASDHIKKICNMILIKILANSFAQLEFSAKVSKKIKCANFLNVNSINPCVDLVNYLLSNGKNICTFQSLELEYPELINRIHNNISGRYKNKGNRIAIIITMMMEIITNQKKLFCDTNEYVICNSIDVKALMGNNLSLEKMTPKQINHICFYNYKLIEDLTKNNIYVNDIEPKIITDLIMPIQYKYADNIVIEI